MKKTMDKNTILAQYDIRHNYFTDYGVQEITEKLGEARHVTQVLVPERISKETLEELNKALVANKPKKGKKKKKKK